MRAEVLVKQVVLHYLPKGRVIGYALVEVEIQVDDFPDDLLHLTGQNQEPSSVRHNSNGKLRYSWAVDVDTSR